MTIGYRWGTRATAKTDWPNGGRTNDSTHLVTGNTTRSYTLTIAPSLGVNRNTDVAKKYPTNPNAFA